MRMVLCPVCGNKRCPRASNHIYACTGSNEVGQVGVDVADMAHRAPQCLKDGASMSPEEIEAIAQRPTCCKPFGEAVTLSRAERDALVALARVAIDPRIREAIEATFEQRPGYMALIGAAVRALPELAMTTEKEEA
jgi:hypothetical protein